MQQSSKPITIALTTLLLLPLLPQHLRAEEETALQTEVGEVFVKSFPTLEETLKLVDEQRDLPESSWIGADKESHQEDINELLDQAIDALELEEVRNYRTEIEAARERIADAHAKIASYRREKLRAPLKPTLGMNELPFLTTKQGYDKKIELEVESIERLKKTIELTKSDFREALIRLGLEVNEEEFSVLLSTINGEDFIEMKVAFQTIKKLTVQLEELTRTSGEDLGTAKKYFGLYTVLLRILNRTQQNFVKEINEEHLPSIDKFEKAARRNIADARSAIEQGANPFVLEQNIKSNQLTLDALTLYRKHLRQQIVTIGELNAALQPEMLTADNTYNTVSLATQVVSLLKTGVKNFEALLRLEPPTLSGFTNAEMRAEIAKLTELMRAKD